MYLVQLLLKMNITSIHTNHKLPSNTIPGLYFADRDGNPRWIWSAASKKPIFLQFFQAITWKQRFFVALIRMVFMLRLQRIVFTPIPLGVDHITKGNNWAVFTGTPGPNRKQVIINEKGTITKIADGEMAASNLYNEAYFLRHLQTGKQRFSFVTPQLIRQDERALTMEKLPNRGTWGQFNRRHVAALQELRASEQVEAKVGDWQEWENIHTRINHLRNCKHAKIPDSLPQNLLHLVALEDMEPTITYGLAHGDFTPWNTLRLDNDQLGIIDWELARQGMPTGFDFFHFHVQKGILVERKPWRKIYAELQALLTPEVRTALFGTPQVEVDRYLRLYLMYHLSYYLSLYQDQPVWHQQIYWQLEVWTNAITALTPAKDQRKALLTRLFEVLSTNAYAVLKMEHDNPQALPANSDLDVLIDKEIADSIIGRLKKFPHLIHFKVVKKSFMATLFLVLKDGQVLNIDLIWKLKRKATVFMPTGRMIQNACRNSHGVSVVSPKDTQQYLQLFYGLNGASVPAKFGNLETSTRIAPDLPDNKGLQGIGNQLGYFWDTFRTVTLGRGVVLTFSGVDGAGKSTVIDRVATMLDKQFRRPVKVLRHRPSVLPILSAYRYGKKGAEQKSIASLPRTGDNTSLLSSLARFGYYSLDYLLGQWYIHLRYVLRGYVVIYDRYYYDFMIDARRSNIQLPSWITAAGFWLLKKPEFNFFLFAHPDTILARKQELTRDTIVSLTQGYHSLFEQCDQSYSSGVFINVENVVLEDTLTLVRTTLLNHYR